MQPKVYKLALLIILVVSLLVVAKANSAPFPGEIPTSKVSQRIVDCTIPLNCSCSPHSYYAYAPSLAKLSRATYIFFCSEGAGSAWDYVRSSMSVDGGINWSTPKIKVMAHGSKVGNNSDFAACDPSIIYYQGKHDRKPFYYMFYGSAGRTASGNQQGDIQVARADTIDGEYSTYLEDGTWIHSTWGPHPPKVLPRVIVRSHYDVHGYGTGQPSVVVYPSPKTGKPVLRMWYTDTTNYQGSHALVYVMDSEDPLHWPIPNNWPLPPTSALPPYSPDRPLGGDPESAPVETNAYTGSVDVKYDPVRKVSVLLQNWQANSSSPRELNAGKHVLMRFSDDGIHWSAIDKAPRTGPGNMFYDGPGLTGDVQGHLVLSEPVEGAIGVGFNRKKNGPTAPFVEPDPAGIYGFKFPPR